jgi:hypothetical protein
MQTPLHESQDVEFREGRVVSPFADTEAVVSSRKDSGRRISLWLGAGAVVLVLGVLSAVFLTRYLNNPQRTLETFPVGKYLESSTAVAGLKFKADLRADADVGWKEGAGRLMLFTVPGDARPIAVMIPAGLSQIHFTKGQNYTATLEVREGGLIYATECRKN